jgi:integral membrane sensor domain MASE1
MPPWAKLLLFASVTAALYVVTARLGLALAMPPERKATAVWLPSGIALAALLLVGYRVWPGIWLGAFLGNLWDTLEPANAGAFGTHLSISFSIASGSTLQALLGACLLRRWLGSNTSLDRARSVFQFVGVAMLMCMVGATIGVTALVLAGFMPWTQYGSHWWTWWLGDTVGILVVTALILAWSKPVWAERSARRLFEAGLLAGLLLGVGLFVFGGWSPWGPVTGALTYVTVPLLVWATFRFGQHGAMAYVLLISGIAVWGTVHGDGPFVQKTLNESLLLLQTFVGVLAMTVLTLAGVLAERRQSERTKAVLISRLENALHEIRTLRGLIPICAWCKNIRNDEGCWEQLEEYLRDHTEAKFSHGICPDCAKSRLTQELSDGS